MKAPCIQRSMRLQAILVTIHALSTPTTTAIVFEVMISSVMIVAASLHQHHNQHTSQAHAIGSGSLTVTPPRPALSLALETLFPWPFTPTLLPALFAAHFFLNLITSHLSCNCVLHLCFVMFYAGIATLCDWKSSRLHKSRASLGTYPLQVGTRHALHAIHVTRHTSHLTPHTSHVITLRSISDHLQIAAYWGALREM